MSLNSNSTNFPNAQSLILLILADISLAITIIGTLFNSITFLIILCNHELRKSASMIYLLYLAVTYTLSLYVWNINHYLKFYFENIKI